MKNTNLFIFFISILCFLSCEAPKKGCNDPLAVNYSFDADEPCVTGINEGDCPCQYPTLNFNFSSESVFKINNKDSNIVWKDNIIFQNNLNQNLSLKGFSFFLSNIFLEDSQGKLWAVTDSITIPIKKNVMDSSKVRIHNNFALLGQSSFQARIGTFKGVGNFKKIIFDIGLSAPANQANIRNREMPTHVLNTDSLYNAAAYQLRNGKFIIQKETTKQNYFLRSSKTIQLDIPKEIVFKIAEQANLNFTFDFQKFCSDIDFNANVDEVEKRLLNNFAIALNIKK